MKTKKQTNYLIKNLKDLDKEMLEFAKTSPDSKFWGRFFPYTLEETIKELENNNDLGQQIEKLAEYIANNHQEEMRGEGAVDTAIAIMSKKE